MRQKLTSTWAALLCALGLGAQFSQAAAPGSPQGFITGKAFLNLTGTAVSDLTRSPNFPENPDILLTLPYFEWAATGNISTPPGNWADNYGTQIPGFFYPPTTGDYVFWICSDDTSELYLSPDSDPANKKLIAKESSYSDPRQYDTSAGGSDPTMKDSSQFTGTQWPTKDPNSGGAEITLQAGKAYYIEARHKEGTGGDNLSVAVRDPGSTIDSSQPIPGKYLSSDRTQGALTLVVQPQSQTVNERDPAAFHVMPDGTPPYAFQWRRNGVDITGATNLSYFVASATPADNSAKYSVVVTGGQGSATSQNAVLTVVTDTTPPQLLAARGLRSLTEVVLTFSEPVDPASASTASNYQINTSSGSVSVSAASVSTTGDKVTLTTAPQTLGTKHTVLVSHVKDTAATPNTIADGSKAAFFPMGKLKEANGLVVFEAENYDRNLDNLWVRDTQRGKPSGGASMVVLNGGSESATQLEYDVDFTAAGTFSVWYRASGDNGDSASGWFHLDGDRPPERVDGNQDSMSGFSGATDFVWRSQPQDGSIPFTVDIAPAGSHLIGLALRDQNAYFDKVILTTDPKCAPSDFGPPETREGMPGVPTVSLTAPTRGQGFASGSSITLAAIATGASGLNIARVDFTANGNLVGQATSSPFSFTWTNAPAGLFAIRATAMDEVGGTATSTNIALITVGKTRPAGGAMIAWVSFHPADDTPSAGAAAAGATRAPDVGYTDLLETNGNIVARVVTSNLPDTAYLNAFDLVIISRSVDSPAYQAAFSTAAWHGLPAPMMILSGYTLRNTRLGFTTGANITDIEGPVKLTALDPAHPIFAGVALDATETMVNTYADIVNFNNTPQLGISLNTDPLADDGKVLATIGTAGDPAFKGMIIGEWQAGAKMADASADLLGGHRLVFLTGSEEQATGLTSEAAGIYDLGADGAKLFLNAVKYMARKTANPPQMSITRSGSTLTIQWTGGGTLESSGSLVGTWAAVPGAASPYTTPLSSSTQFYRVRL